MLLKVTGTKSGLARPKFCWDYEADDVQRVTCSKHTLWQVSFPKDTAQTDEFNTAPTIMGPTRYNASSCCLPCCHSEAFYNEYCKRKKLRSGEEDDRGSFKECCPHRLAGNDVPSERNWTWTPVECAGGTTGGPDAAAQSGQFGRSGASAQSPWKWVPSGLSVRAVEPWYKESQSSGHWANLVFPNSDWWDGSLPQRYKTDAPKGHQIADFVGAVLKYQVFCAHLALPSKLLYDEHQPRPHHQPPRPFSDATMQRWVSDLFSAWLKDELQLPLEAQRLADGSTTKRVPPAAFEYGGAKEICAQLPSVVNYVSGCDCRLTPQCTSTTEHKFTYFFGSTGVVAEENIKSPVPTSCSYFRQLEAFDNFGVSGYNPLVDIVRTSPTKRAGIDLSYHVNLTALHQMQNLTELGKYKLRERMRAGMVTKWNDGLDTIDAATGEPRVWTEYYQECRPTRCFYEKVQESTLVARLVVLLSAFGGLVIILKSAAPLLVLVLDKLLHKQTPEERASVVENRKAAAVAGGGLGKSFSFKVQRIGAAVAEAGAPLSATSTRNLFAKSAARNNKVVPQR